MSTAFSHQLAAHCESGTVRGILSHHGLNLSEPMVFGIGAGIFFGYFTFSSFSFHKIVCRSKPGSILKNVAKLLRVRGKTSRFRNRAKASAALDEQIDRGQPVALQVDMFHMDYIPEHARVHFNAHFVNVFARSGDGYDMSDAYMPEPCHLARSSLEQGRFVRGDMAPKGFMYYPTEVPRNPSLDKAVAAGIRKAAFYMTRIPIGPLGVRGIRRFADTIIRWPALTETEDRCAHEMLMIAVTMEDMGTGGGGFRYMYASFLQEAAELLANKTLEVLGQSMRANGDAWREIALLAARTGRDRNFSDDVFRGLSERIRERAAVEDDIFRALAKAV